ncbi:MAG: hypothetical protein ACI8Z9_000926 [Paraglaciecola sp.]|jgi:hypothetical protein
MQFKLLSDTVQNNLLKQILPILFVFAGFQAHATTIATIGNLSYDGTLITGDGRTYLGLDTLAASTYLETVESTSNTGQYADYRIANTADADYFIGSLFGSATDNCSNVDGIATQGTDCGSFTGWTDGLLGANFLSDWDDFFFLADESSKEAGFVSINSRNNIAYVHQNEDWSSFTASNNYSHVGGNQPITWLVLKESSSLSVVPEPSTLAIFALGLMGLASRRFKKHA